LESNVLEIGLAKYRMYRDHGVHSGHDSTGNLIVGKKAIRYTEIIVKRTKGKGKKGGCMWRDCKRKNTQINMRKRRGDGKNRVYKKTMLKKTKGTV
jgi:hypothetical protein